MNWHFEFLLAALAASAWLFFTGLISIPLVIFWATKIIHGRGVLLGPRVVLVASALFCIGRTIVFYISIIATIYIYPRLSDIYEQLKLIFLATIG